MAWQIAQVAVAVSSSLGRGTRQAAEPWQRGQWGLAGLVPSDPPHREVGSLARMGPAGGSSNFLGALDTH